MAEATVMVADHEQKHSPPDAKRAWTLTRLIDAEGIAYSTFDKAQGQEILRLKGKMANISYEQGDRGNDLKSIAEFIEFGSQDDAPLRDVKLDILDCLKIAERVVDAEAESGLSVNDRWKRIKILASEMAVWVDEYAERAANPPFVDLDTVDDGIAFAPEMDT